MAALDELSALEAKMRAVYLQAGPEHDLSKVTVLGAGTPAAKVAAFNQLDQDLLAAREASGGVDRSGRALAARAGGFAGRPDDAQGPELGRVLVEAMQSVQSGRYAAAFVDPAAAVLTDVQEHERKAAGLQLAAMGAGGMYASSFESGPAGAFVPVQLQHSVRTLRAGSVVLGLPGVRIVQQTSDRMRFPRVAGVDATTGADIAVAGIPEGGSFTDTTPDVDSVDLVPVKFGVYHTCSSELIEDANEDVWAAFAENAIIQLGLKIDLGMLEGTGASQLVGLRNTPGISTTSVAGTPADFDKLSDTLYAAELANANPTAWVMHPRSWNTLSKIKTGLAADKSTLLEPDPQSAARTLLGMPVHQSTQITLVEGAGAGSWVAAVDPSQIVVGVRRPPLVEFSRDANFQTDMIAMRISARYSFGLLNPAGVSIATDVRA